MERIKQMLEHIQEGNLVDAKKLLVAEMDDRKAAIISRGKQYVAESIKG